jgi:hypothetical protein
MVASAQPAMGDLLAQEEKLPVAEAVYRALGLKIGNSQSHRIRTVGVYGVKLETMLVLGRRCSSVQAVQRFNDRINAVRNAGNEPVRVLTPKQARSAQDVARAKLAKFGVSLGP